MTKSTAKTLTLTAKQAAPRKAAPLAVPKTATSYFIEGDDSAPKVSVVKTRSRLAAVNAASEAHVERAETVTAVAAVDAASHDADAPAAAPAAATTVVRRRVSKLAALKSAEPAAAASAATAAAADVPRNCRQGRQAARRPQGSSKPSRP